MRGNVGAMATRCGKFGSRCRFFRSIDRLSDSRAALLVIVADARVDGVAEHLPDVGSGGERRSAVGGDGIPVDVVGVREVKHRTPGCSDRSRCCAVGGHDFAGLGVANPVTELMAPQEFDYLLR